ncbi:hypothetical protein ES703_25713 [subsurface metagenome]
MGVNIETSPQWPQKIEPLPRFALGEPFCAPPDDLEEEGQRPVSHNAVNAQGASEQWVMVFTGAHHDKLPRLSIGGDLGGLDPEKMDLGHDLLIGCNRDKDLPQLTPSSFSPYSPHPVLAVKYSRSGLYQMSAWYS